MLPPFAKNKGLSSLVGRLGSVHLPRFLSWWQSYQVSFGCSVSGEASELDPHCVLLPQTTFLKQGLAYLAFSADVLCDSRPPLHSSDSVFYVAILCMNAADSPTFMRTTTAAITAAPRQKTPTRGKPPNANINPPSDVPTTVPA